MCERALDVAAGKIDTANTALSGMWTVSRSGASEIGVENVPAMTTTAHAIINDERHDNGAGRMLTTSNVLRPTLRDHPRRTDSISWIHPDRDVRRHRRLAHDNDQPLNKGPEKVRVVATAVRGAKIVSPLRPHGHIRGCTPERCPASGKRDRHISGELVQGKSRKPLGFVELYLFHELSRCR
jgi:hypothetical protein